MGQAMSQTSACLLLEDALDAHHAFRNEVEVTPHALDLLHVALHDEVGGHVVIRGDHLHLDLLLAPGVFHVVRPTQRRDGREGVPQVTAGQRDGAHQGDAEQTDGDAEGDVRGGSLLGRDVSFERDHFAGFRDFVVVASKVHGDLPGELVQGYGLLRGRAGHLERLAIDLGLGAALDEGPEAGRGEHEEPEGGEVGGLDVVPESVGEEEEGRDGGRGVGHERHGRGDARRVVVEEAHAAGRGGPVGGSVSFLGGGARVAVGPRGDGDAAAGKGRGAHGGCAEGAGGAAGGGRELRGASRGRGESACAGHHS
mmetsp:Transcript_14107/g.38742  ORF Transcript_14107/g.38742 Transcript_14107/m.38742 type:complete len:311 (-) Transcript_14107:166-1098(-)